MIAPWYPPVWLKITVALLLLVVPFSIILVTIYLLIEPKKSKEWRKKNIQWTLKGAQVESLPNVEK